MILCDLDGCCAKSFAFSMAKLRCRLRSPGHVKSRKREDVSSIVADP
jgi:hypothetical protein